MNKLNRALVLLLCDSAIVSVQNPVLIPDFSEPEPDFVIFRPEAEEHEGKPVPSDVLLVIEVSDTTLAYDRKVKLPLYASAGVPEVWIADLKAGKITRYSGPGDDGHDNARTFERGDIAESAVVPRIKVEIDKILP